MSNQGHVTGKLETNRRLDKLGAVSATALGAVLLATPASAIEFGYGEVQGYLDTIVSAGASMRTSKRNCENISKANGGCQV